jgi:hypothetical protein
VAYRLCDYVADDVIEYVLSEIRCVRTELIALTLYSSVWQFDSSI